MSESKVNERILSLSSQIAEAFKVDAATGNTEVTKADIYAANLPEGHSEETVRALNNYNADFATAATHAFGNAAIDAFHGNKDLQRANLTLPMVDKDALVLNATRERTINQGEGKDPIVSYGSVTAQFDIYASGNRGQMKVVKKELRDRAHSLLGS